MGGRPFALRGPMHLTKSNSVPEAKNVARKEHWRKPI